MNENFLRGGARKGRNRPLDGGQNPLWAQERNFVYFYQNEKNCKLFCENPLTILDLCDKIVNCIIIALIMGISVLLQGRMSTRGDFQRLSLCSLTKDCPARSTRLRPRHLPCPWVVRLIHEVPDVRVTHSVPCAEGVLSPFPCRRSGIRPTVSTNVFEWSV